MKLCPKCQKQFSDDANFCPVDAARLAPIDAKAAGGDSLSTRFELGDRLGGNHTGAVFRAIDKQSKQACVVKLVAKSVVSLPGVAQRLERELKQLERVHSAGVAKVLASGKRQDNDETWVAMELLADAHTLADAISSRGPIPLDQAADLIEVIGEALIEAAQVGVVHRDLAPKNILFAGQDVKLINFSLPVPTTDKVPGVAEFVAPEQVEGRPVDQRSNLYSLGALYYYVLTGQTLFTGDAAEVHKLHVAGGIKPPSQVNEGMTVPAPIEAVIMRALDRSPTKRFLTVRQFVDEVSRVGHGEVIELKQIAARAAKPKAELVQTLMGVRGKHGAAASIASAPTVGGLPAAVALAPTPQQPAPAVMSSTVIGVASGPAGPTGMKPIEATAASPWSPPAAAQVAVAAPIVAAPVVAAPVVAAPVVAAPKVAAVAAPVVAAPVVAAPQVAAPQVAAPKVAAAAAAPAKRKGDDAGSKGKFRETMWFKKGDLDAQAAQAAADERARTGKDVSQDLADSLPIDERYKDDGSISARDKDKYSLRTGGTQMMAAMRPGRETAGTGTKVSEDALIGEMKGGRRIYMIGIAVALVLIVLIVLLVAR